MQATDHADHEYRLFSIIQWFPLLLIIGLMIYSSRQMKNGMGGGMGGNPFGVGKAKYSSLSKNLSYISVETSLFPCDITSINGTVGFI